MSENGNTVVTGVEGVVKWFDPKKGFGFIHGPNGEDVFVHFSQIEGDGFRVLKDGSNVEYDAEKGERGWHATRVKRKDPPEISVRPTQYNRSPRR